jgi:hypothetical protein
VTSRNRFGAPPPPFESTQLFKTNKFNFGCVVCNTLLKQHTKRDHPSCFDNSSIINIADCAKEAEKCLRENQTHFQRNHCGDTDEFFDTGGGIAAFQCGRCSRCPEEKG